MFSVLFQVLSTKKDIDLNVLEINVFFIFVKFFNKISLKDCDTMFCERVLLYGLIIINKKLSCDYMTTAAL